MPQFSVRQFRPRSPTENFNLPSGIQTARVSYWLHITTDLTFELFCTGTPSSEYENLVSGEGGTFQ